MRLPWGMCDKAGASALYMNYEILVRGSGAWCKNTLFVAAA